MTAPIFFEWLQSFNLKFAVENRKYASRGESVDYLEIDSEVEVHEIPEAGNEASAVREADDTGANDEHEDDRNDPPPVSASIALAYRMELSSFLFQSEGDTKREQEMLQAVTRVA
ncbi:unnamed protein product [Phytophthora fragariaefolia]|uniref:Unnamed protein product n=1 Tax=Phytophthora fragariaefolia TaxID=1490495 RepID=A0A9W6Y2V5_9STRA|nr:unnamed protein product [Phytophthora fragariaefolia]